MLLNRAPYVVIVLVAFAPDVETNNPVFVLLAAAVPVAAIETTLPDVIELDENVNASPVVKLFAVAFSPEVAPVPVVTPEAKASSEPSEVKVLICPTTLPAVS